MIIRRWLGGFVPLLVVTVLGFQVGAVGVQASPFDTEPDGTDVGAGEPVVDPGVLDQGERDLVAELGLAVPPDQRDAPDRRFDASRVERVSEVLQFRSEGSETWVTDDGGLVTELFSVPQWYRGSGGE